MPVAAVIIRATAAAIGSTPGPLEVAAMMSSSSATSRSASTRPCTACGLTPPVRHRKMPSRNAVAAALVRSLTPSLR